MYQNLFKIHPYARILSPGSTVPICSTCLLNLRYRCYASKCKKEKVGRCYVGSQSSAYEFFPETTEVPTGPRTIRLPVGLPVATAVPSTCPEYPPQQHHMHHWTLIQQPRKAIGAHPGWDAGRAYELLSRLSRVSLPDNTGGS